MENISFSWKYDKHNTSVSDYRTLAKSTSLIAARLLV